MKRYRVGVVNPLPQALAYYDVALKQHLSRASATPVRVEVESVEELGRLRKIATAFRLFARRTRVPHGIDSIVVEWPALGYLDVLTWWRAARHLPVSVVVHDVDPLRQQFGYSSVAKRIFAFVVRRGKFRVITHTREAAERLHQLTGISAAVIPHPINSEVAQRSPADTLADRRILVLGQFKEARSIDAMRRLPASMAPGTQLRAVGRGWPAIPGWDVVSAFVSEEQFDSELRQATAVMLPYHHYQQSGVMVRAFELGIPVVGHPHVQLRQLYGDAWPGIVINDDWAAAVERVLDGDFTREVHHRRHLLIQEIDTNLRDHVQQGRA